MTHGHFVEMSTAIPSDWLVTKGHEGNHPVLGFPYFERPVHWGENPFRGP